ncbi:Prephenate dehydratase-domain-containing protein [Glomus cerebriforme]|uniref:Bifunctional chorismate mutase/prephenate dehydratase n=1 Tax=Glomus cerebriforme TaxID=658196 RepID=A0A397T779_9GLOM|nr:Prephenate dehydratase-domain-containing protein [Glomus cerebriforme]
MENLDLQTLNQQIDSIDTKLVQLLNERACISLNIEKVKKEESSDDNENVHAPGREKQTFERIHRLNYGPLSSESLGAIYREIISASISLQKDVSIAYFGPLGSYTHQAAIERFGDGINYFPQPTISDVFDSVEKRRTTYGIVPFENSTYGSVVATLDKFISCKTHILAETYLRINHCLLSKSKFSSLNKVYSHPQGFGQCQKYLDMYLKEVQRVDALSTSKAAEIAASEPYSAAIASITCAELYGLDVLEKDIQDVKNNVTRFFILGSTSDKPSGDDKTFILFTVDHRQPGALCDALSIFKDHNINLTKIDSRPSLQQPWHYVFFIELQGHKEEGEVQKALNEINEFCLDIKILGSYPNQRPESLS